jgi:hypothetical protein
MEQLHRQLTFQGYQLQAVTDSRLIYRHRVMYAVVHVVRPPEPGKVKVRVVVHKHDDWAEVAERLAQAGVELDHPRAGYLPKYPATQRAYGVLDLNAQQPDAVVGLHAELAKARARAQKYKPTSYRGEAVSPFLRLVERVSILMRENE